MERVSDSKGPLVSAEGLVAALPEFFLGAQSGAASGEAAGDSVLCAAGYAALPGRGVSFPGA